MDNITRIAIETYYVLRPLLFNEELSIEVFNNTIFINVLFRHEYAEIIKQKILDKLNTRLDRTMTGFVGKNVNGVGFVIREEPNRKECAVRIDGVPVEQKYFKDINMGENHVFLKRAYTCSVCRHAKPNNRGRVLWCSRHKKHTKSTGYCYNCVFARNGF